MAAPPQTPPSMFESVSSVAPNPSPPPSKPKENSFLYNCITNKNIIALSLVIANFVAVGNGCSMTAIVVTNSIFLSFAALALGATPPTVQGKKWVAYMVTGYAMIVGLVALNVLGVYNFVSPPVLGWIHLGACFITAGLPVLIDHGPRLHQKCQENCRKQSPKPRESDISLVSSSAQSVMTEIKWQ